MRAGWTRGITIRGAAWLTAVLGAAGAADAQPLGSFRWQLQPYCNVVTVTITQSGSVFRLEGLDDRCGAGGAAASVIGTAFLNANGSVGFGLNIVDPGGTPLQVDATASLATLSGTWRDSASRNGAFTFTPGAGTGGGGRPPVGPIGAAKVDAAQVQLRVSGACPAGQYMQSVGQTGTVTCATASGGAGGTITSVTAGAGLVGGGTSAGVTLALRTAGNGAFDLSGTNGLVSRGTGSPDTPSASGAGSRLMWLPHTAAIRAGAVDGSQWDAVNLGPASTAFGRNTIARGNGSIALGVGSQALASASTAAGAGSIAQGLASLAVGYFATASGVASAAIGASTDAAGDNSVALGNSAATTAAGLGSFVYGDSSSSFPVTSSVANQFLVRAAGGVVFWSTANTVFPTSPGVVLYGGTGAWSSLSDAHSKEHFRELSGEEVLARLAAMPVREWSYKTQDAAIRHVGPTAQDFHAAFGLGEDERRINSIDADGIALAAVRALEARTRELAARHEALAIENEALRARLERLETRVKR